jgi:uncharacterized protein (TIGR04255 family)
MADASEQSETLPEFISPCPLIDAIFSVWFDTSFPPEAVFGVVYQEFSKDFPAITTLPSAFVQPEILKANPALSHQPTHRLDGNDLTLLIGSDNFAVGMRGQYPGWAKLKPSFLGVFKRFDALTISKRLERFGLRYINFFDSDILSRLTLQYSIKGQSLDGTQTFFRTVLGRLKYRLALQVMNGVTLPTLPGQLGSLVDIDVFLNKPDTRHGMQSVEEFLNDAHSEEKKLFFDLLTDELRKSLNPVYPSNA